ncbi:deleted in malignant brain tumors 1 protein-like [Lethenteron reissneri]|uniref:deleted in malignant brain tumors 1 protein-like n=1 Tax=Lethenteron reissneri TaxID=7753 RepID=UPI002AB5E562|nr:deleted in malignant brain tumors 1 protein-like [Lethenteron reissneri]
MPSSVADVQVRLVGGGTCHGRVEVQYRGAWGTVCDDFWELQDAEVVCHQLSCGSAVSAPGNARYGAGSGQIWMDNVQCNGSESQLSQCRHNGWGTHDCSHVEDASVVCSQGCLCALVEVRLVGGGNACQGRVEVLYGRSWGTVCDDVWNLQDAEVVCRQLGCGSAVSALGNAFYGAGSGQIWMDNVQCSGSESQLSQCRHNGWGTHDCSHVEDASVICSRGVEVRLVGGGNACQGRVEVLYGRSWGTVCDDVWDLRDAEVVCRQLGCGSAVSAVGNAFYGVGSGRIWMDNVQCNGSESQLSQCRQNGWGTHDCSHVEDASVICSRGVAIVCGPLETYVRVFVSSGVEVRLVDGGNACQGRVEVLYRKFWGTVCDDVWDLQDTEVVCRQLGCGSAVSAVGNAFYGVGSGQIWMDNVQCNGSESQLSQCRQNGWGTHDCSHVEDASVICSRGVEVRLVGGGNACQGRVEVLYKKFWGTVCDDFWELQDAEVVCRQLGCGSAVSAPGNARYGAGSGRIWMDNVQCNGSESQLSQCRHNGWGTHDCSHVEDASVVCSLGMAKKMNCTQDSFEH